MDLLWRPTTWVSFPPILVLVLAAVVVAATSTRLWVRWVRSFPIFALELVALGLIVTGLVGHDYGLSGLFWHEDRVVQFIAGFSLGTLALLVFFLSFVRDDERLLGEAAARIWTAPYRTWRRVIRRAPGPAPAPRDRTDGLRVYLNVMLVPVLLGLFLYALVPDVPQLRAPGAELGGAAGDLLADPIRWPLLVGSASAVVAVNLVLWLVVRLRPGIRWRRSHAAAAASVPVLAVWLMDLSGPPAQDLVTAVMACCVLLAGVALIDFATYRDPLIKGLLLLAVVGCAAWSNSDDYKLRYPGLDRFAPGGREGPVPVETRARIEAPELSERAVAEPPVPGVQLQPPTSPGLPKQVLRLDRTRGEAGDDPANILLGHLRQPADFDAWKSDGRARLAKGELAQAALDFGLALRCAPEGSQHAATFLGIAEILERRALAWRAFDASGRRDDSNNPEYRFKDDLYEQARALQWQASIEWTRSFELSASDRLSDLPLDYRLLDRAASMYRRAHAIDPTSPEPPARLGRVVELMMKTRRPSPPIGTVNNAFDPLAPAIDDQRGLALACLNRTLSEWNELSDRHPGAGPPSKERADWLNKAFLARAGLRRQENAARERPSRERSGPRADVVMIPVSWIEADLRAAVEVIPDDADHFLARSQFFETVLDDLQRARLDIDVAINLRPAVAKHWMRRRELSLKLGESDVAADDLEKAVHADGKDVDALYQRALARPTIDLAIADLDRAIRADRRFLRAYLPKHHLLKMNAQEKAFEAPFASDRSAPESESSLVACARVIYEELSSNPEESVRLKDRLGYADGWYRLRDVSPYSRWSQEAVNAAEHGRYEDAIEKYDRMLLDRPVSVEDGFDKLPPLPPFIDSLIHEQISGTILLEFAAEDMEQFTAHPRALLESPHASWSSRKSRVAASPEEAGRSAVEQYLARVPGLMRWNRGIAECRAGVRHKDRAIADLVAFLEENPFAEPEFIEVKAPPDSKKEVQVEGPGVADRAALRAWERRWAEQALGRDAGFQPRESRPTLIVVAVSGGGIAAAYWTISCLTALEDEYARAYPEGLRRFPDSIRLVTGASGGMLGAAHYVTTLTGRPNGLPHGVPLATLRRQIGSDFLTPVVRRLVLGDVPSIFDPRPQTESDRGRTLDQTLARNTGGVLGRSVGSLRPGEEEGWRPSLIIAPMVVEDSAPLLISNLDLPYLSGGEFSRLFKGADLSIATAVRMNAAFPYVTPAVMLPTRPARRVVDAGYLDNYGVGMATAWIEHNREWLVEHTGHVLLVRIEAYPRPRPESGTRGWKERTVAGLSFASTPVEGLMGTRAATANARNEKSVEELMRWFSERSGRPDAFLDLVLECTEEGQAPLSWYLSRRDQERMVRAIRDPGNRDRMALIVRYASGQVDEIPDRRQDER